MTLSRFSRGTNPRQGLGACMSAMFLEVYQPIRREQTMLLRSKLWYASSRMFPLYALFLIIDEQGFLL